MQTLSQPTMALDQSHPSSRLMSTDSHPPQTHPSLSEMVHALLQNLCSKENKTRSTTGRVIQDISYIKLTAEFIFLSDAFSAI